MHVVTQENSSAALDAVRDILLMYQGMAADGLILHSSDWPIRFDPLIYVDAVQDRPDLYYLDFDLLRTGSAIVMVARYFSAWSEERGVYAWTDTDRFAEAITSGRLRHLPDIEAILVEHLSGRHASPMDPWFDQITPVLCERHVRGYFRDLAAGAAPRRDSADWVSLG
jgi:hypothetical protein